MRRVIIVVNILTGILMITVLILTCVLPLPVTGSLLQGAVAFDEGWQYLNGEDAALMELDFSGGTDTIITRTVTAQEVSGRSICFVSRNIEFSIFANGEEIYDFHPELRGFYGRYYGDQVHIVTLPIVTERTRLKIVCTPTIVNKWTGFDGMVLENAGEHILGLLRKNAGKFVLCIVTFFAGLVLFLFGIVEEGLRKEMLEPMSLGVIAMLLSVWSSFPTDVVQILTGNFASSRVFEHIALMLLPIPVLIFVGSMTKNLRSPLLITGIGASILNLLVQSALVHLEFTDYHELLIISHVLILTGIAGVGIMVVGAIRRKVLSRKQLFFLLSAIAILFTSGMIDMIRYYFTSYADPSQMARIGLFLFISLLAVYEFRQLVEMQVRSGEAEMMHRLAMEDALTGLRNRTAFNQHEEELKARREGKCLFVHMDVNYLKKVNDTYGHAEGDRHIIAAANVILESFGEYGMCYRVGGDEFFAILEGRNCEKDYERAVAAFRVKQRQYNERENPPVPLQLAHGMAEYNFRDRNPEAAEKLADSRMYENKRMLKLASA